LQNRNGGRQAELDLVVQYAVTRVLAESSTLAQAGPGILESICQTLGFKIGSIWTVDPTHDHLRLAEIWHTPDPRLEEFEEQASPLTFGWDEGLPGRVWASREPMWIADVQQDPGFTRRSAASRAGLHAALAFPILRSGRAIGAMEFLSAKVREPDDNLLRLMAATGAQIGQFIGRKEIEQLVLDSEALKTAMIESALDCIITIDQQGRIVEFNPAAESTFGYSRAEAIGARMVDLIIPLSLRQAHKQGFARYLETGEGPILGKRLELTGMRADGSEFPVELTVTSVEVPGSSPKLFTGYVRDISDRKQAEEELRRTQELHDLVLDNSQDLITLVDLEGTYLYVSPSYERILGYAPEDLIGRSRLEAIHPEDVEAASAAIAETIASGTVFVSELRVRHKGGHWVLLEGTAKVINDPEGRPRMILASSRDVTDRRRAEQQIAFMAFHDKLTGLANRAKFEELMEMALARARRHELAVAVLYLDLDNFKLVNDSLGHAAGDDVLREVAARLISLSRETDVVARLGGDEFLVLLSDLRRSIDGPPGTTTDAAVLIAESVASRIHDSLRDPFVLSDTEFYVSASVGVSIFPLDAEDGRSLLKNADAAMYHSKKSGPGGFVLFPASTDDPRNTLSLATRLRKAVENEDWVLHYQPIIDLVGGKVVGVEGLLRWQDPDRGIVLPGEFLPLAEEMGFMERIGDWVMKDLFRQASRWRAQGLELNVSFNLSPRQLWHPELMENLLRRLDGAGVDPSALVIEITESAAMADVDRTQYVLSSLRNGGLRFAIDDFGTGYSSLSRLRDLPVDILKIDRSFVRDLPGSEDAMTVVQAIIQLALSLGMAPLAEGIETEEQWRSLLDHGCRLGQGFYFQRPVPAEEIPALCGQGIFHLDSRRAG
jgi:diguanylate cyclase (GGDEF)-like protein/PAS domain S-box-containing protein